MSLRLVPVDRIDDADTFRLWLAAHRVHGLDAEFPHVRRVVGTRLADGQQASVEVPTAVMRALDGEIAWAHDPDGAALPPDALFGLRAETIAGPEADAEHTAAAEGAFAEALARGRAMLRARAARGELLGSGDFAALIGSSQGQVEGAAERDEVISVEVDGEPLFPVSQVEAGALLPGIGTILAAVGHAGAFLAMERRYEELGGLSGRELVRRGMADRLAEVLGAPYPGFR